MFAHCTGRRKASLKRRPSQRAADLAVLIKERQAHADNADDHNSESANEGPPKVVLGVLLVEPPTPKKICVRRDMVTSQWKELCAFTSKSN
jgi:hypothetical protein